MDMSFFFFKQKTAYEMRISDWSSDVSLPISRQVIRQSCAVRTVDRHRRFDRSARSCDPLLRERRATAIVEYAPFLLRLLRSGRLSFAGDDAASRRSDDHTSEPTSLMRISYAVFSTKKHIHIPTLATNYH